VTVCGIVRSIFARYSNYTNEYDRYGEMSADCCVTHLSGLLLLNVVAIKTW